MSLNVELIRESFEKAKPIADKVADKFYENLWGDFPVAKALFENVDMKVQKKALVNSLVFIVDNVDNPDKLVPYLKKMGTRHVPYGTEEEHYAWVGQSLLKTFAFFFGDEWTDELESEWTTAYQFIAGTMLEGAAEYIPQSGDLKKKAKTICNSLLMEVLSEGIDEEFEAYVRARVRRVLFKVLEEESEELFKKAS
tara:strand:+ start:281 stop:868 length:588 start_codon:yes stop_codon:yes gene_type:complete